MCRIWHAELKQDGGDYIARRGNMHHAGASEGWSEVLRLVDTKIEASFEDWKESQTVQLTEDGVANDPENK